MPTRDEDDDYDDRPRRRSRRDDPDDEDDDYDDRPRRRRSSGGDDAASFLVPVGVSPLAVISCYAGLIGCVPIVGLVFAIPALICGILALRKPKKATGYGGATSNVRAIIGVVLSSISILGALAVGVLTVLTKTGVLR